MAERTKTALRGFLIPDRYVTSYDSSAVVGTGATQAGPKAGRPVLESTAATDQNEIMMTEEVIGLGSYGKVLTILYCEETWILLYTAL